MAQRRLTLHASALNDEEYKEYTAALKELAEIDDAHNRGQGMDGDDEYYEGITLGVREVRAWLRGRYSSLEVSVIDNILKLFSPNLGHGDTLSGGQVFVVLRLVMHVTGGKELERGLAFIQARARSSSRPASPSKRSAPQPPPPPRRSNTTSEHIQPPQHPSTSNTNPFTQRPPPKTPAPPPLKSSSRSEDGRGRSRSPNKHNGPPLPPRKSAPANQTTFLPPPRHSSHAVGESVPPVPSVPSHSHGHGHHHSISLSNPSYGHSAVGYQPLLSTHTPVPVSSSSHARAESPTKKPPAPAPPPKPPSVVAGHVTSNLMKQSLQASKVAQSVKRAEERAEKERVMQVLKSSSGVGPGTSTGTPFRSTGPPPPPAYTKPQPPFPSHSQPQQPRPLPQREALSSSHPHLHPTRTLQVASSSHSSGSSSSISDLDARSMSNRSTGPGSQPNWPPRPFRPTHGRVQGRRQSSSVSVSSLEQVALAIPQGSNSRSVGNSRESSRTRPRFSSTPFLGEGGEKYMESPSGSPTSRGDADLPGVLGMGPPPMHPDRKPPPPPPPQLSSFDAVYGAGSASSSTVFGTPLSSPTGDRPGPSPTGRVGRSRSMHQPGSPLLFSSGPSPFGQDEGGSEKDRLGAVGAMGRKKRPESMQVGMYRRVGTMEDETSVDRDGEGDPFASPSLTVGQDGGSGRWDAPPPPPSRYGGLSRHASLGGRSDGAQSRGTTSLSRRSSLSVTNSVDGAESHSHTTNSNSNSNGYPTPNASPLNMKTMLSSLQSKSAVAQEKLSDRFSKMKPGVEKGWFKAEAGLNVRRGYVGGPRGLREGVHGREEKEGLIGADHD
ncbi:hypothetical protein DFP72DRAFT_517857 [Ephemerocybe angulata]|uniref:Uncharacterized protein n=1 Tax=Ephemerocybe angulata TaxID=980116 RepID=A0A8H6HQQ9_9AGAR|nr:hypothetical protein DFP72DRAFT_517857 [Tulosesus angulatus]